MSVAAATAQRDSVVILHNVTWRTYNTLRDVDENRHVRMTYDRGELFLMSPGKLHERISELLAQMVCVWTEEHNIPRQSAGSTTMRSKLVERGFEPDKSFYLQNEQRVRTSDHYDPATDPPPDLTIEVDVASLSSVRMPIYAQFGVPEVWRWVDDRLEIHRLQTDAYTMVDQSVCLPGFPLDKALKLLDDRHRMDETGLLAEFRKSCRS